MHPFIGFILRHSLAVFLLLTLVACSSDSPPDENDPSNKMTVEEMYKEAKENLDRENYETAIKKLEALQSRYPYGRYAQQALLEVAYAYYKQGEPAPAISAAERFIKQFPNSPNVDYAFYVKGLANFGGERSLLDTLGGQDPTERDPKAAQDAFDAFRDLVTRFPDSKYAPDSRVRMQYLTNALAKHEIHVAKYYLRRGAQISAVNRAKEVLTKYPNTPATQDALLILVQGYDALGLKELRDDAQRVLDKNFPKGTGNTGMPGQQTGK